MEGSQFALSASLALIVGGLAALLWSEAAGLPTAVIAGFGVVVLAGVGVLTATVARVPEPDGAEDHGA
jgi:hypothetical protein